MIWTILLAIASALLLVAAAARLFLHFCPAVGKTPGRAESAAYAGRGALFSDECFHNEGKVSTMTGKPYPSSDRRRPAAPLPVQRPAFASEAAPDALSFTWFGHSSFLLQLGQVNILADPIWSERSSPVQFLGPRRFSAPPLKLEELPPIDLLFLSHDHYDHLDYRSILAIRERVSAFVVPLGVDAILCGWGVEAGKIHALAWWESVELGGLRCTLTPSQHFSGRNPFRRNCTLWGGMVFDNGFHRVYYTGDGGYCGVFKSVRERLGSPELMIAECGQYDPAWAHVHMFPEQSVQAGVDVGAKYLVPVHWGGFSICNHAWDDSVRRAVAAAEEAGLALATPRIGQTVAEAGLAACTERWWETAE